MPGLVKLTFYQLSFFEKFLADKTKMISEQDLFPPSWGPQASPATAAWH